MPDQTVLVHPDLPDVEYEIHPLGAQVLSLSGWTPKAVPTAGEQPEPDTAQQDTPPPAGGGKPPRKTKE